MRSLFVASKDGVKLFCRKYHINNNFKTIILAHGFAEHSQRYYHIVKELNALKFNVVLFDFRGHGYSEGSRGHIDSFNDYIEDMDAIIKHCQRSHNISKIMIFGHSMGGLVAAHYAYRFADCLDGLILASPFLGINSKIPKTAEFIIEMCAKYTPFLSFPSPINPQKLTHDANKIQLYKNDPLIFSFIKPRWFIEIINAQKNLSRKRMAVDVPLLLQLSGDDHIVDVNASKIWFEKCHFTKKSIKIYNNLYHEIYNEIKWKSPLRDMKKFLAKFNQEKIANDKTAIKKVNVA